MYTGLNTYMYIKNGQIALHRASDKGVILIVQELLKFTQKINTKGKHNYVIFIPGITFLFFYNHYLFG